MSAIRHIRKNVFQLGQKEFAEVAGVTQSTVSRWENGVSPSLDELERIRVAAFGRGIEWSDALFFESPVGPSSGEAGASSPPAIPRGAPAISAQGGEAVSHRVHTPKNAGSIPAPATSFPSPEVLPSGEAGARRLNKACRAPNSHGEVA